MEAGSRLPRSEELLITPEMFVALAALSAIRPTTTLEIAESRLQLLEVRLTTRVMCVGIQHASVTLPIHQFTTGKRLSVNGGVHCTPFLLSNKESD